MLEPQEIHIAFTWKHFFWASMIGAFSAISLFFGSVLGVILKPSNRITGFLAAFGAGALMAALTIELIAPTVNALGGDLDPSQYAHHLHSFYSLIIGCIVGGLLFISIDKIISSKGGFLRKTTSIIEHFAKKTKEIQKQKIKDLSHVTILRSVKNEHIQKLVDVVKSQHFNPGEIIFKQGDSGDFLFFIRSGTVQIIKDNKDYATSDSGNVLGEIALLTGSSRTATAVAKDNVKVWALGRKDFDRIKEKSPELAQAARDLAASRIEAYGEDALKKTKVMANWTKEASKALRVSRSIPSIKDLQEVRKEHSNAGFAIWLGILLDGVPESFVIGAGFLTMLASKGVDMPFLSLIPYTLIAGLFLSNFPEALSSSVTMKQQGSKPAKIIMMWSSLVIFSAIGASLGYTISDSLPHSFIIGLEGLAAGAMLTMIASAMLPEAAHLAGQSIVGLSTLLGFLSVIAFKLLE